MEVVNHDEGLQVDDSRHASPQTHYGPSQAQHQYSYFQGPSKNQEPASTYLGTPSPNVEYSSQPQVYTPPSRDSKRPSWLIPALLGGLIAAFVVGGAVGGGLGSMLAQCQSKLTSATATSTSDIGAAPAACPSSASAPTTSDGLLLDYTAPSAAQISNIKVDCTKLSASVQISQFKEKFVVQCGMDYPGGIYSDSNNSNRFRLEDMGSLRAYSFQDCIDACSSTSRNAYIVDSGARCMSVTFGKVMKGANSNCWLKNATQIAGQGTADDGYVSARLNL